MNSTKVWTFTAIVLTGVCAWLGYLIMEQEGLGPFSSDQVRTEDKQAVETNTPSSSVPTSVEETPKALSTGRLAEERKSEMRGEILYLKGKVATEIDGAFLEAVGVEILGEDNVVNEYEVDDEITTDLRDDFNVAVVSPNIFGPSVEEIDPTTSTPPSLDALLKFLEYSKTLEVEILVYTDTQKVDTKPADQNEKLAEARAVSIKKWLVEQDIAADRITTNPQGETDIFGDNTTAEGRELNRRTVFKFSKLTVTDEFQQEFNAANSKDEPTNSTAEEEKTDNSGSSPSEKTEETSTTDS